MKAIYKGKKVKVLELITSSSEFISKPILVQVKIEWKEDGTIYSNYVDSNDITFTS